jgi:hypothetical protein
MTISRIGGLAAAALISAALLVGCGSSSDTSTSGDTAPVTAVSTGAMITTGVAKCDAASLTKAVQSTSDDGTPVTLAGPDAFRCADGWAYANANTGDGDAQFTETLVFQAEGQFWVAQDRSKVCTAPDDMVPAALYKDACETN